MSESMEVYGGQAPIDYTGIRERVAAILSVRGNEKDIVFERVAYSRSQNTYIVFLYADILVTVEDTLHIREAFREKLPGLENYTIVIRQPGRLLLEDKAALQRMLKKYMVVEEPALVPFVRQSKIAVEGNALRIVFGHALAPKIAKQMSLDKKIEHFLKQTYALDMKVQAFSSAETEEIKRDVLPEISELFDAHVKKNAPAPPVPAQIERAVPAKKARPASRRRENGTGAVTKIAELLPEKEAVVEGEVLSVDSVRTRDGKNTIFTLILTDYTSSVYCRKFYKGTAQAQLPLRQGDCVRVEGRYLYNTFNKEYVINIKSIVPIPKSERMDTAEEKRVELHLHTNMSAQDGMTSAAKYIARAAKWGHKAIAITDHGVVQAFPEAATAAREIGNIKILFGVEAYVVDVPKQIYAGKEHFFDEEFIVFDVETTGLSCDLSEIIEIGAVRVKNGKVLEKFQSFAWPKMGLPYEITRLTGITEDMLRNAPAIETVIEDFWRFAKDTCLIAHNAAFDTSFVFSKSKRMGREIKSDVLDTLLLARVHLKELKSKSLDKLAAHYNIPLQHHRAVNDAECTAQVFYCMVRELAAQGFTKFSEFNTLADMEVLVKSVPRPYHMTILCKNKEGLVNLYRLISLSHIRYFHRRPRIPKNELLRYRKGLLFGSACEQGELYRAVLSGAQDDKLEEIAGFYDYLEIQPHGNNAFLVREDAVPDREKLSEINRKIYALGKKLGKPVVATGDVHFLDEHDVYYRQILMETAGFKDADEQAPLYLKTTGEMLEEFSYLGEEAAREVVVENTQKVADSIEDINLFPGETAMPTIENADTEIREAANKKMHALYGDPLPAHIEARLFKELDSIIRNGYAVLYWIAMKLVNKSMNDGYLVGSRGSVGSSLAAFAMDITEVNPLPPHYRCPVCKHSDFDIDKEKYDCGADMPPAICPVCGAAYVRDGYDIPFEVFLGLHAEKVPDIDLNFSGEYRTTANKYIEELFGAQYVYRAGTISAIKENSAKGIVRKYLQMHEMSVSEAEIGRLAAGISGVKKTTGQHPGGLVIVPKDREIYEFTPIQKPADKMAVDTITTHFDFNSMHDILVKLDILGHDNPTILKMLADMTGVSPLSIPLDDPATMSLFNHTEALDIRPEQIRGVEFGTLGIPEFGTRPSMRILKQTMPKTISELVRISGLSHGTNVWKGNAEDLILSGVTTLRGAICTRDDIMLNLVRKGVEHQMSFFIMESVRRGKWAAGKEKRQTVQEKAMRDAGVAEWFIESCRKIQYMFPKAHAVAYVVMSLRIAYFKVHYPKEFYAASFTIKAADFNAALVLGGIKSIQKELDRLDALGIKKTATEKSSGVVLEIVLEMMQRGYGFLKPDIKKSRARKFVVEGNNLRVPFITIPMLGEKAADLLEEKAKAMEFSSVEELKRECKLSQNVVDTMREMGCFAGLPEKAQLTLFEAFGI